MGQNDPTEHPAVFPEKLCADHIWSWSNEGDLVYDPFMGSGTTAKMAHKYNEIGWNEKYDRYIRRHQRFAYIRRGTSRILKLSTNTDVPFLIYAVRHSYYLTN